MTDKQITVEVLSHLPEAVSLSRIAEELQVVAAIREGQADVIAGRVRPHKEVEQLLASWNQRWTMKSHAST